jgi:hypothetical protein
VLPARATVRTGSDGPSNCARARSITEPSRIRSTADSVSTRGASARASSRPSAVSIRRRIGSSRIGRPPPKGEFATEREKRFQRRDFTTEDTESTEIEKRREEKRREEKRREERKK